MYNKKQFIYGLLAELEPTGIRRAVRRGRGCFLCWECEAAISVIYQQCFQMASG